MVNPMARALSFLDRCRTVAGVRAGFVSRVADVPVSEDKWETLALLEPSHREAVDETGFGWSDLWRAEQVHGDGLAVVPSASPTELGERMVSQVDGLLTMKPGVLLGIYVADCAAVYLVDRAGDALALVHSGKKGTELGIAARAVERMEAEMGSRPEDLEAAISPCIRPPHYESDFVTEIERQLIGAGIPRDQVSTSGICTAENVHDYYSYRREKGKTGRMLAILGRTPETGIPS